MHPPSFQLTRHLPCGARIEVCCIMNQGHDAFVPQTMTLSVLLEQAVMEARRTGAGM